MGQFSMEKPVAPGSALSGNQQYIPLSATKGISTPVIIEFVEISATARSLLLHWRPPFRVR